MRIWISALLVLFVLGFMMAMAAVAEVVGPTQEVGGLSAFLAAVPEWLQAFALLTSAAATIAALWPSTRAERASVWLRGLHGIINALALNVLAAKNREPEDEDKLYDPDNYPRRH
jgi:hypothetical protein